MKCVCPMGGDRTCPDDCPLAVWATLSPKDRKAQRKPIVERLAKQGFTQAAIATQLGVTQQQISKDLSTLQPSCNVKGQGKDTRGRKKSSGRPKGSTATRRKNTSDAAVEAAKQILDFGKSYEEMEQQSGLSNTVLRSAVAREEGRREPNPERSDLSMTAQEKYDAALRQAKRKLDLEFEDRCRAECLRWLNDVSLPQYHKELTELERSITSRRGIMDRAAYRKILSCLHPDRVDDPDLKKRYEEAFRIFNSVEKRLLDEKESPTEFRRMPRTVDELMAMRAKVQAERRAKRAARH